MRHWQVLKKRGQATFLKVAWPLLFVPENVGEAGLVLLGSLGSGLRALEMSVANVSASEGLLAYRQGTFANESVGWKGNYVKGQQWSAENPIVTPNYAQKYGLPAENSTIPDWIVGGRLNNGSYTTRISPASHNSPVNTGGGIEILPKTPSNVEIEWFHMPDK